MRIGVAMATTGRQATRDGPALDALLYAVRQVNNSGGLHGRPLEIAYEDSRSELNGAYQAARRLVGRDVPVIFATCDPYFNRPIREEAGRAGVLVIIPCGPLPQPAGPLTFSAGTSATAYGRAMAEHAADAGIRSAATLVEADNEEAVRICDAFSGRFAELGGSVAFSFSFDRHWIAAQPVVGRDATALALSPIAGFPIAVICSAVGGRGGEFFDLLRSAGVATPVLAAAALDSASLRGAGAGHEPLTVVSEASTYGDDISDQANAYFASLITGDLRRGRDDGDQEAGEAAGEAAGEEVEAIVEDRVGWAVTGAEALWLFVRAAQRTASLDPAVLAADIERFDSVELWMEAATFGPDRHAPALRALRVIRHDGAATRLVEVRIPSEP
ncbi:MAG: ABC transporter substrate-binding protein [bacterium]|nr:ABC transporter substrate-binding protein [bacterium]